MNTAKNAVAMFNKQINLKQLIRNSIPLNWIDTDAVEVECTVTGIDNAEIDIKATVGG